MYGYVFAAANNSLWHTWDITVMKYPTFTTMGEGHGPLTADGKKVSLHLTD